MPQEIESKALAEQILSKAIQEVVFKYNAYAPIISSFRIAYTDLVPTLGVDKYARLVVNPEFIVKNEAYAKGLIVHETLHVFFGHTGDSRTKLAYTEDQNHNKIANIAEDCAINQFISEPLPDGAITPSTLREMIKTDVPYNKSAEEYYDLIMNSQKDDKRKQQGQGGQPQLSNSACSTDEANTQQVQDELDRMGVAHLSEEEVNERVLDTAVQMCKSQGNQYGHLVDFAREMLEPKVDWRPLLTSTIRNAEKKVWNMHARSTYKRTNKRSRQVLLPKKYGHKVSTVLSFDTSGSITQEMVSQFLAEIQACMRYSEIKECALWHTSNYWYGTPEQLEQDIEKVFESGGTDNRCVEECATHAKADIGFAFTDGEWGSDPQKPEKCMVSTMMAIIWNGTEITEIRKLW